MSQTTTIISSEITLLQTPSPKYRTSFSPNPDFIPPKDFEFPQQCVPVPLNPKGPTEVPIKTARDYSKEEYEWKEYLPYNTVTSEGPLAPYEHVDPASRADPAKAALFSAIKQKKDITPEIGTEISGTQLSQLTEQQKDELALLVAERGVVVFRGQDFVHHGPEFLKEYGDYFGRLHVHQWGTHAKGHPEFNIVFRDSDKTFFDVSTNQTLNTTRWHSDMTYEVNPPAITFLATLSGPECGGDTLYLNAMTAYDRLSEPMKEFLSKLTCVHSSRLQTALSTKSNLTRREPIDTVHPVIRTHPVTGRKALWVNPEYTTNIVGLKKEESDSILKLLFDHLAKGLDFHTRVKWEPDSVVVYDNRMVQHSVVLDYPIGKNGGRRHLVRITPQGERPVF